STAHAGRPGFFELLLVGVKRTDFAGQVDALVFQFQVAHDFGKTENTHGHGGEVDAVLQFRNTEVVAGNTRVDVGTDHAQQQAQQNHANGLGQGARRQYHGTDQAQHH